MGAESTIFQIARSAGFPEKLAYLIVSQAQHETNGFTSNFFKKYNNAFGYSYYPGSKYQTGPGSIADNGQPIAAYASVIDSAKELVAWIKRRQKEGVFPADLNTITTVSQYAKLFKDAGYYGASLSEYTSGMQRFYRENPTWAASLGGTSLLLIGIAAYFFLRK